jgi:hypothetical protein
MTRVEDKELIRNRRSIPSRPRQTNHGLENSAEWLESPLENPFSEARSAVLQRTSFESRSG